MASDGPRLSRSLKYFDKSQRYGSFGQTVLTVFGGIFVFVGALITGILGAFGSLITTILDAFGVGAQSWIFAFTRDPAGYISDAFQFGGQSLGPGSVWFQLGPFLPWIATAVSIGVVMLVSWFLDRRDSDVPGLGIDLPLIGNDEDGDFTDEQ